MTDPLPLTANPFALMMDPAAVLRAVEQSQRLLNLRRRICRPLDKQAGQPGSEIVEIDGAVDQTPDVD